MQCVGRDANMKPHGSFLHIIGDFAMNSLVAIGYGYLCELFSCQYDGFNLDQEEEVEYVLP